MTLVPQTSCTLLGIGQDIPELWCVFEHHLHDPATGEARVIYVNSCRLIHVFNLAEAQRNTQWIELVKPGRYIYVKVVATGTRDDCRTFAMKHLRTFKPYPDCNAKGINMLGMARPIECSNGKTYTTQSDAAEALGLHQGNISSHLLRGRPRHVGGFTFWYKE